jgi:surface antigen
MKVDFTKKYPEGYRFYPTSPNDYSGQCAWFVAQLTKYSTSPLGAIGNAFTTKKSILEYRRSNLGTAFRRGEQEPEIGQAVLWNIGTYGHVSIISEKPRAGIIKLTESNYPKYLTVTHYREVSANDPAIYGYFKTIPNHEYIVKDVDYSAVWVAQTPNRSPLCNPNTGKLYHEIFFKSEGLKPLSDLVLAYYDDINVENPVKSKEPLITTNVYHNLEHIGDNIYRARITIDPRVGLASGIYRDSFCTANPTTKEWVGSGLAWVELEVKA